MRRRFCHSSRSGRGRRALVLLAAAISHDRRFRGDGGRAGRRGPQDARGPLRLSQLVNVLACDELRNHIATILRALGARDDVQVRVNDCEIVVIPDDIEPPWDRSNREYPRRYFPRPRLRPAPDLARARAGDVSDRGDAAGAGGDREGQVAPRPHLARDGRPGGGAQRPDRVSRRAQAADAVAGDDPPAPRALRAARADDRRPCSASSASKWSGRQLGCDRYGRSRLAPKLTVEVLWPVGAPMPGEKEIRSRSRLSVSGGHVRPWDADT